MHSHEWIYILDELHAQEWPLATDNDIEIRPKVTERLRLLASFQVRASTSFAQLKQRSARTIRVSTRPLR